MFERAAQMTVADVQNPEMRWKVGWQPACAHQRRERREERERERERERSESIEVRRGRV